MKSFKTCVFIALFLILNGCSSIDVKQDYNAEYNFNTLKTYNWLDTNPNVSSDSRVNNDLIKDRMTTSVEAALKAKGYTKVDRAEASFLVTWLGAIDKKLQVQTIDHYYRPYGYGSRGAYAPFTNSGSRKTIVSEYDLGTILIDILDPKEHKLIWRGTGQGIVHSGRSPEQITKGINNAVQQILEQFPPTHKK